MRVVAGRFRSGDEDQHRVLPRSPVCLFNQASALIVKIHFCQTAFVINSDCRAVIHRIFDVVTINVIAKYLGRVDVCIFSTRI